MEEVLLFPPFLPGLFYPPLVGVRVRERDISEIVEVLAPYANKWREIGTRLGFTQHELNNIQCNPMTMIPDPIAYLTAMLSQWVQWTFDGPHHDYATFEDLNVIFLSHTVDLGGDVRAVCSKLLEIWWKRWRNEDPYSFYCKEEESQESNTRVHQSNIPEIVELLSPHAYKWRKIGTRLGFTQHELNNIQSHPMIMILGPIGYLTAMLSQWVQWTPDGPHQRYATFEDLNSALKSQTVDLGVDAEDVCTKLVEMATTKQGLFKKGIETLNVNVMVTRKRHHKYTERDVARWWFEIWGDDETLPEMKAQWQKEIAAKHTEWRLETCPVVNQKN